ncbi:hypothetical protein WJX84_004639 [Apatococcus fuscideae]|uniref:Uncharacterized protein n=1 Tax=Apatococcus fuscideae TaxID=2026836 RepID=A0AAW1SSD5_9CHLO
MLHIWGAPHWNHAFANEYGRRFPQTWHIINDQDAVARMGKFLMLYKRPGLRVLVNLAEPLCPLWSKLLLVGRRKGARWECASCS